MSGWLSSGWDRLAGMAQDTRETDALGRSKTGTPDIGLSRSRKGSGQTHPPNITQHPPTTYWGDRHRRCAKTMGGRGRHDGLLGSRPRSGADA